MGPEHFAAVPAILRTKLETPPLSEEWVARPQLIERLREGQDRPLVLLSAPAGYGKTTLLTQWAYAWEGPVAWLTLDGRDNDPFRFLRHLVAALPRFAPDLSPLLERAQSEQYLLEVFETLVVAAEKTDAPPRLVLDEYQVIDNPRVHEAITHVVDATHPPLRILIGTRTDPPLPLARWRLEERLLEIRGEDLQFGAVEIGDYLETVLGPQPADDLRTTLTARTEGWIAGLKLACLSLRDANDRSDWISGFSGTDRHVIDYLLDEVLEQQTEERRSFLRRISILDAVSGPLADAVTGSSSGQIQLEEIERSNLFLVPLDQNRGWYRLHPLLRDLLASRLETTESQVVPELHARAAGWYEAHDRTEEAAHHAIEAGEFKRAARLLDGVLDRVWSRGHIDTFTHWIENFPPEIIESDPSLAIRRCWAELLRGEVGEAREGLARLESALESADALTRARAAVLDSHLSRLSGDISRARTAAESVLSSTDEAWAQERTGARVALAMALFEQGHARDAHRVAEEALESAAESDSPFMALLARLVLGHTHAACGRLTAGEEYCHRTIDEARTVIPYDPIAVYIQLARIHRQRDELEKARAVLDQGRQLADRTGRGRILADLSIQRALLERAENQPDRAEAALVRAEEVAYRLRNEPARAHIDAWRARFAMADGDLERARRWRREYPATLTDLTASEDELRGLTLVRVLLAEGETAGLMLHLADVHRSAVQDGRTRSMLEAGLLQARVRRAEDQVDQAIPLVERCLELAAPERYIRVFVDEGLEIEDLVRRARGRGHELEHCDLVLEAFERARGEVTGPVLEVPLTPREQQILELIESGLSNKEICASLFIAEATVKTHVNKLYRKLGVKSRTQAVAVARDLRLL